MAARHFRCQGKTVTDKEKNEWLAAALRENLRRRKSQAREIDTKKDDKPEPVKFAKGSYIVRMDQPYSRLADTLLDVQYVRGDERVYDDTGWTLGYLFNVDVTRVANPDVLKVLETM